MKRNGLYDFLYPIVAVIIRVLFRIRVSGVERLPEGGAVVCVNHSSWWDPFIVMVSVTKKYQLHAMAKAEILSWPVLGWLVKHAGSFGVDRGHADIAAVKTALTYLKSGEKLLIFPEGTRVSAEDATAAKSGVAMMAVRGGVPIVPIYLKGGKKMFHPTPVIIGEPIYPVVAGRKGTAEEYRAIAENTMRAIYELGEEK